MSLKSFNQLFIFVINRYCLFYIFMAVITLMLLISLLDYVTSSWISQLYRTLVNRNKKLKQLEVMAWMGMSDATI